MARDNWMSPMAVRDLVVAREQAAAAAERALILDELRRVASIGRAGADSMVRMADVERMCNPRTAVCGAPPQAAHSETPLASVLAYDAGREEQAAEVERLTARVKERDLAIEKLAAAYKELAEAATSPRLRAAPRVGVEEALARLDIEAVSAAVHRAYCEEYAKQKGEPYWTGGDYNKLDEKAKEYDRATLRAVLKGIAECWPAAGKGESDGAK